MVEDKQVDKTEKSVIKGKDNGLFPEVKVETNGKSIFVPTDEKVDIRGSEFVQDKKEKENNVLLDIPKVNILFECNSNLYKFDGEWKVCGVGNAVVVDGEKKRIMFIRNKILTSVDVLVNYDINLKREKNKVYFMALENEEGETKMITVAIKFKDEIKAQEFCDAVK